MIRSVRGSARQVAFRKKVMHKEVAVSTRIWRGAPVGHACCAVAVGSSGEELAR